MAYLTFFLVLASIVGGSLSFKASSALPGEVWYPYKLEVNERIESFVANTDEAKARWNLAMIQTRLSEARMLARHSHLTFQAQNDVSENMQQHIKNVTGMVEKLQKTGYQNEASVLAGRLYQTLNIETQKVADVSSLGSTNLQISLAPVVTRLRVTTATVALISTKANAKAAQVENAPTQNLAKLTAPVSTPADIKTEKKEEVKYFK